MLPVVLVTALDPAQERVKGLDAGADDFLSKPVNQAELLARVRSLLRIKTLYDEVLKQQAASSPSWNRTLERRVADGVAQLEQLGRLKRFFSPQLAELIVAGGADDPLKSHRREITVVFLDLRGFTAFTETADPEEVMAVLGEYHAAMGRLMLDARGHAGALLRRRHHDLLQRSGADRRPGAARRAHGAGDAARGRPLSRAAGAAAATTSQMGVGIAQGFATHRRHRLSRGASTTARSAPSPTWRRGSAARPRGGEILVSQRVAACLDAAFRVEPAGELVLKGFHRPVPAFRVLR